MPGADPKSTKLWGKGGKVDAAVEAFTSGDDIPFDQVLVPFDCRGSIAHARMLGKMGLLEAPEVHQLVAALEEIITLHRQGGFIIRPDQEDCHTAIEAYLTEQLGETGQKIHTARSRNDQVLTALRLYYRDELESIRKAIKRVMTSLDEVIARQGKVRMPGYTHTRKAMPSTVRLWLGAFRDALKDDRRFLKAVHKLVDQSPLGSAAGYGVPLKIDRAFTARELGFERVQRNAMYVQHSRGKFEAAILHAMSQILFDLNRLSGDLILFSMPGFGYVDLPPAFCTGSSIMPQKHNPDVLELVRGHYHQVIALEHQLLSTMANLISGYHRDAQLTKGPVMTGLTVTRRCLEIMAPLLAGLQVNKGRCEADLSEELFAAESAYALVREGIPFREAYRQVAQRYHRDGGDDEI